ncbi:hypothetical protein AB3538_01790 [Acinetobacter baumannii]
MDTVLGAIEQQAISKIPEYLTQEYNAEIEHFLRKKKKLNIFFLQLEMIYLQLKSKKLKNMVKTVIIQAQNRDQPLTSFAGRPIERYKEIRVFYQKKISALETQKVKLEPTIRE